MEGGLPYTPWAKELRDKRFAARAKDNPDAQCLPMGFLQFHQQPQPRMIIQTEKLILIEYEANYGLRHIYMDGRELPPAPQCLDDVMAVDREARARANEMLEHA